MSFVYFIQEGRNGPVKIGRSKDPERRLRRMQTSNATELRLLLTVPGGRARERKLHQRFQRAQRRGEWFESTPQLRRWIAILRQKVEEQSRVSFGLCVYFDDEWHLHVVFKDDIYSKDKDLIYFGAPSNPQGTPYYLYPYTSLFAVDELYNGELLSCRPDLIQFCFDQRNVWPDSDIEDIGIQSGYEGPAVWYQAYGIPRLCRVDWCQKGNAKIWHGEDSEIVSTDSLRHPGDTPRNDQNVEVMASLLTDLVQDSTVLVARRYQDRGERFLEQLARLVVAEARVELGMTSRLRAAVEMWGDQAVYRARAEMPEAGE